MDYQSVISTLEAEVSKHTALTAAVNHLKSLASWENAVQEVSAVHEDVTAKVAEAKAELLKALAAAEQTKSEAAEYFRKMKDEADVEFASVQSNADRIHADAVASANVIITEAKLEAVRIKDSIKSEIEKALDGQAQVQADAALATQQLQELQTQVQAARDRLEAIRNAARRLSE